MKSLNSQEIYIRKKSFINRNNRENDFLKTYKELSEKKINNNNKKNIIKSITRRVPTMFASSQEKLKRIIIKEFGIQEKAEIKIFDYFDFISKESCTSYYFGDEPIEQKAFFCSICDVKKKNIICNYCYNKCHQKCRKTLKEIPKSLANTEYLNIQTFSCYCSSSLKHIIDAKKKKELISCTMLELDTMLGIMPYHCYHHNITVCCICAVVCHKECFVKQLKKANINGPLSCQCKSDFHSNFNELALSFPLEQYKKVSNIDVWPVQILNILFNKGKTFDKMSQFFNKSLTTEINFNSRKNFAIINKFQNLLELFSDTFNRKFKTYYYDQQMINTFEYNKLFLLIKELEVNNSQTTIIKFRLLFILLFIHLRKDFKTIKSLTSNDFICNNVLQRLEYKKILFSKSILTDNIDEKYRISQDFPIKEFILNDLCYLLIKGMNLISVEENQDEFEIGLKIVCFMLKRLMFNKEELIILIERIEIFHSEFHDYIMKEKNNIYSLIDIFNIIVEICYVIAASYNDLVIEEYLNGHKKEIGKFIHAKSEHSNKLLSMILKNCDLITKHYKILIKPTLDEKSDEEQKREIKIQRHLLAMQAKILSQTTGVTTKMPDNGGLFTDKIITLNIESLALFSLADNNYQKQLNYISDEEIIDHFSFCKKIEDKNYQEIMIYKDEQNNDSNNILYNLKKGLEDGYYSLFTSSYIKEETELNEKLKREILMACENIKKNIENKCNEPYYSELILDLEQNGNNIQNNEIEKIRRKILKDISSNICFADSPFLLIEEGRELIVNNLIMTQVDESIFKGLFFLTNIHFPNIIDEDLVKIFFDFLYLFLMTKRGIMYILTGKNIQNIQRLINRFRFDEDDKNVNILKKRTADFNVKSIKIVIHFLCILSKFIRKLNIKTLKKHKAIFKFRKSIISHLKYFIKNIKSKELILEYKIQLKEGLEIFNNLFEEFNFNQFEKIKRDIIEIFKNNKFKVLNPKIFQKWFEKRLYKKMPNFMEIRKYDLDYYFQFFEILTKNSFYVYENDEEGKQNLEILIKFIDIENLNKLLSDAPELINLSQKRILLKFIRTFYLIDQLDQVNYFKKYHLLQTKQYKSMLKYNLVNESSINFNTSPNNKYSNNNIYMDNYINQNNIINKNMIDLNHINVNNFNNQNFSVFNNNMTNVNYFNNYFNNKNFINYNSSISNNIPGDINSNNNLFHKKINLNKNKYINKLKNINNLIILIEVYIKQIELFPNSIKNENNDNIKKFIKELVFATQEISTTIYYDKDIINKILPYYYKLVIVFYRKKDIFIKILKDIEQNQSIIDPQNYMNLLNNINKNKDYKYIISRSFNIFNKNEIYRYAIKCIFEIFKNTNINEDYSLRNYLEIYDVYNEANFPPFSLLEIYDYEYFYDGQNIIKEENENDYNNDNLDANTLNFMREAYLEQFRGISDTAFLGILTGETTDKKIDYGEKYVNLFQSFINSTQSNSFTNYRMLLCIMTKMLFYDGEHIQNLFNVMIYDKFFFNNLNKELNYLIVQSIDLSQKYELCSRCAEISDMTKLTIQFIQLLGEGFNTKFHENILKGKVKSIDKKKLKSGTNKFTNSYKALKKEEESSLESENEEEYLLLNENKDLSGLKNIVIKKETPLVDPKCTIYETAIFNLKRIYHLMELNNLLEGESAFDKLCVLSSNIIDFIIEYIDTLGNLTYIIDDNFKNLFFGKAKTDNSHKGYLYIEKNGILPVFTMRIKDDLGDEAESLFNKYKLRKTMMAYMKIKYFQLLKSYLQIGNKKDFVRLLLSKHLGPIQLFGEIIYYMKELINDLIYKDFNKYHHLLNVDNINLYKEKLIELYMFEDDFRTSVELSVIFQICIIIAILENKYKIKNLRDNFNKELIEEDSNQKFFNNLDGNNKKFFQKEIINEDKTSNQNISDNNLINKKNLNMNLDKEQKKSNYNSIYDTSFKGSSIEFLSKFSESDFNSLIKIKDQNQKTNPYINITQNYQKNKIKKLKEEKESSYLKKEKKFLGDENLHLNTKFSKAIYKFLDSLISKVEIRLIENDYLENIQQKKSNYKPLINEITRKIINCKNKDTILSNINYGDINGNNLDNNFDFELNNEEDSEIGNDFEEEDNVDNGKKYVFFIKPYLSFHLSEQTKTYFLYNVNRSTATSKYRELVSYSDYFMFEMIYNMKYINNSKILIGLSKISFYFIKCIIFFFILIENILLMIHYYRDYSLDYNEYYLVDNSVRYKRFIDIDIIIIIKIIIIFFVLFVWFYCKFIITFQRNIIVKEDKNFIFRQLGQEPQNIIHPSMVKFFREKGDLFEIMTLINRDVSFLKKIKVAIIDSILFNTDINIFVFSFVLDILFLIFGHPLFLSFETLFIYGVFSFLVIIFKSFTEKLSTLLSCLLFNYLIIYVYNYITIFYLRDSIDFGKVFHYDSEILIPEKFCQSSIQCFLVLISYGTRAGGGIGDNLPKISYKRDINMFFARFVYDMSFYILVIMIMGNVTFGLIVDSFGALRDETYRYENDRKNKCFICQLSRDGCLLRNIDYEKHIKKNHQLWSYVDFLCYLHLYNANDFTRIEGSVWDKLLEKDYDWIPINKEEDDDNQEDD